MNFDWSRFKNYGLWVSIMALIPMILSAFGVKIIPEEYQAIANTILSILVALGIISNPTTEAKWYIDDNPKNDEKNIDNK
ncbi:MULTISPECIES: phage holin [unclassified Clostridium]|jgi:bacteriophage holin|uniref:phage holin n=1 Tax=unclassified Clostridium TaxID=2614128 RepID=UPI0025C4D8FB|nr:phage holin [Clostridium sp.]MCI6693419.1 phage holin [Clostridium sp.]MDY2631269.1 phage holin [Clostridium sp.]MDY4252385.1 phage holin [Clostridium sp.]MDY6228417.1 phage holin [Clostridium sp.]